MGHKILLADDSITIQKVIELTFSDEDFTLHTVGNGQKAIDEIRTVRPDIVLCDIIMPEKNGYEVCEFIKSQDDLKQIPVLLLTGAFEPFDQERARKAGCDGFLAKPFEPQTLISKVKQLLESAPKVPREGVAVSPAISFHEPAQAPPPPPPVPQTSAVDEGATMMDQGFAIEAGERELSFESGDQTVLLGSEDTPTVPSTVAGEDVWSQVQQGQETSPLFPGEVADDAATIFMESPPESEEVSDGGFTSATLEDMGPADDGAWVLPTTGEPDVSVPEEPELTPLGDFSGFDDFASSEQGPTGPYEVEPPELSQHSSRIVEPPSPPMAGGATRESPGPPPRASVPKKTPLSEMPEAGEPLVSAPPEPVPPVRATPEPEVELQQLLDEPVFDEGDFGEPSAPAEISPKGGTYPPRKEKATVPEPAAIPHEANLDQLAEKVAERLVHKLSDAAIREIAWEVVPDLARTLIQKEIDALKAKIPK